MKNDNINSDFIFNIDNNIEVLLENIDKNKSLVKDGFNNYKNYIPAVQNTERFKELEKESQIRKLQKIMEGLKGKDPKQEEDNFFKQVNCTTEKDKLILEIAYINKKLEENSDRYKSNPNYSVDLKLLNNILEKIDELEPDEIPQIKQLIILIELDFKISIAFVSEVENIYKLKTKNKEPEKIK